MSTDHLDTFRTVLTGAGITNVSAGNVYTGPFPEGSDDIAVSIIEAPGFEPSFKYAGESDFQDGVQVIVRGERDGHAEVKTRARAVKDALHGATPTGYTYLKAQGGMTRLAPDSEDRPRISTNFIARITE
jgi:hypothetical protein